MSRATPTEYERQMAGIVVQAAPSDPAELLALIAEALAAHRARTVHLALAMLPKVGIPSEQVLERMSEGWTPREVHELISAHRAVLIQLRRTRELLPAALGERPAT
jgi:hypothetical protein